MAKNDDTNPATKPAPEPTPASALPPDATKAPATPAPAQTPPPSNRMIQPGQARVRVIREQAVYDRGFHFPQGTDYTTSADRAKVLKAEGAVEILAEAQEEDTKA